jgi:hypothetical protein
MKEKLMTMRKQVLFVVWLGLAAGQPGSAQSGPSTVVRGADPTGQTDSKAAFEAALAATPSGTVSFGPGVFRITSTIRLNRNQQLEGAGAKASTFRCAMLSTPCVVVGDTEGGVSNYGVSNLREFSIMGPGLKERGSIGIYLGGDPAGKFSRSDAFADFVNMESVRITGFETGVMYGNNAYANKLDRVAIYGNSQGIFFPKGVSNSGEGESISNSSIFNNRGAGINLGGDSEWFVSGSSFDYNGEAAVWSGSIVYFSQCHFEEATAPILTVRSGSTQVSIRDSEFLVQDKAGTSADVFDFYPQGMNITISHISIYSNYQIPALMRFQGNVTGSVGDVTATNIGALGTVSYSNPRFSTWNTPWDEGIVSGPIRFTPGRFNQLEKCTLGSEGTVAAVNDSRVQTWGAVIEGGGAFHVMAYCDGTSWSVAGK